ncbi:MAG: (2Fe-2S)-binding protein [bacterium]|nr:(2Fe-2S)-binding protein [bacterium]
MSNDLLTSQMNALMRPRMVCVCKRVPEARIREVVAGGAASFEEVQNITQCATGCGTCEGAVRSLLERIAPESESTPESSQPAV